MGKFIDMTGKKFDRLKVERIHPERNMDGELQWECRCKCGGFKITTRRALRNKFVRSCGCLRKELNSQKAKTLNKNRRNRHPKAKELLLELYSQIKSRNVSQETMSRVKNFLETVR